MLALEDDLPYFLQMNCKDEAANTPNLTCSKGQKEREIETRLKYGKILVYRCYLTRCMLALRYSSRNCHRKKESYCLLSSFAMAFSTPSKRLSSVYGKRETKVQLLTMVT